MVIKNHKFIHMKRMLLLMIALLLAGVSFGQLPAPRLVDKEYRSVYRDKLKSADRTLKELEKEGWDIVIDLPGRVPTEESFGAETIDHWGKKILLPDALVSRLIAECTQPIVGKISDTGVDENHPELAGGWWLPASDYTGDGAALHIHGTHVAGIAFSLLEPLIRNGTVTLKSCRNLGSQGQGQFSWAVNMLSTERPQDKAFEESGKHVLYNMSWGGMTGKQPALEDEFKETDALGVIFIAAAGNTGGETPSYPASSEFTLATASLDENLQVSSYSTRGIFVDNAMPGRGINSTVPGGGFAKLSGTSMASPMLFSAAIIAKSKYGDRIPNTAAMREYLAGVAIDIDPDGWDKETGWGIVYFTKILDTAPEDVIGEPPPPPSPPETNVAKTESGRFFMRWQYSGERSWRMLYIPRIRFSVTGPGKGEEVYDAFLEWLPTYFVNRGIALPDYMDGQDAAWWTGRFLQIIAKNAGWNVSVLELEAVDETGRLFFNNGFDGSTLQARAAGEEVKLIELE